MDYVTTTTMDYQTTIHTNVTMATIEDPDYGLPDTLPDTRAIRFYVMCTLLPLICLIGVIGNILSLIVWWKEGSISSTSFLLQALAVVDTLFLINYFVYISVIYYLYYILNAGIRNLSNAVNSVFWVTKFMAVYTIVIIAIDRCIAVSFPLRAQIWVTAKRAKIAFVTMTIVSILYNLPRFIRTEHTGYKNKIYRFYYMNIFYNLIYFVLPITVVTISNSILIANMRRAERRRRALINGMNTDNAASAQNSQNTRNVTQILIIVITLFIICEMPAFLYNILESVYGRTAKGKFEFSLKIYKMVTEVLFACNSSSNFFIYCLKGKKFRCLLKRILCGHRNHISRRQDTLLTQETSDV